MTSPRQMNLQLLEPGWWHFPHDADMGIAVVGPDLNQAFEQAAVAMTNIITDSQIMASNSIKINCQAPDLEGLLVDWLNSLIFEMAVRGWLFGRFQVEIKDHKLSAQAWGEPIDRARHKPAVEIKGATFTGLYVRQDEQGMWRLRCILDV